MSKDIKKEDKSEETKNEEMMKTGGGESVKEEEQSTEEKKCAESGNKLSKINNLKWIVMAVVAVILAVAVGTVVYTQSPSYKAREQLELGEKYLADLEYEQAIVCFELAMELDPDNEEILTAIAGYIDEFYEVARAYGQNGEYASEKKIAAFILKIDENSVHGKIADAEADCGNGEFVIAKISYEEVRGRGVDEQDIEEGIEFCSTILQLLSYCEENKWIDILAYLESEEVTRIMGILETGKKITYTREVTMILGQEEESRYVYCGDVVNGMASGNGTVVVSSTNTNAMYEGRWEADKPEGNGILQIWNKNEDISRANEYSGNFVAGILNGNSEFKTLIEEVESSFELSVNQGAVSVYQTDEKGNVWLIEETTEGGCAYIVEYIKESNGVITEYLAGLPGFGGSDQKLSITLVDVEAPVITCKLVMGKYYDGRPGTKGIVATDNIDGDITDKIVAETTIFDYGDEWSYGVKGVYKVTDSAGNTSQLVVKYHAADICSEWYYVLSVE